MHLTHLKALTQRFENHQCFKKCLLARELIDDGHISDHRGPKIKGNFFFGSRESASCLNVKKNTDKRLIEEVRGKCTGGGQGERLTLKM